jgi:hypothetical protein
MIQSSFLLVSSFIACAGSGLCWTCIFFSPSLFELFLGQALILQSGIDATSCVDSEAGVFFSEPQCFEK